MAPRRSTRKATRATKGKSTAASSKKNAPKRRSAPTRGPKAKKNDDQVKHEEDDSKHSSEEESIQESKNDEPSDDENHPDHQEDSNEEEDDEEENHDQTKVDTQEQTIDTPEEATKDRIKQDELEPSDKETTGESKQQSDEKDTKADESKVHEEQEKADESQPMDVDNEPDHTDSPPAEAKQPLDKQPDPQVETTPPNKDVAIPHTDKNVKVQEQVASPQQTMEKETASNNDQQGTKIESTPDNPPETSNGETNSLSVTQPDSNASTKAPTNDNVDESTIERGNHTTNDDAKNGDESSEKPTAPLDNPRTQIEIEPYAHENDKTEPQCPAKDETDVEMKEVVSKTLNNGKHESDEKGNRTSKQLDGDRKRKGAELSNDLNSVKKRKISMTRAVQLKMNIFSEGRSTHKAEPNYAKLFESYWGAIAKVLKGNTDSCTRNTVDAFLSTRNLRKLHNSLIFQLLSNCYSSITEDEPSTPSKEQTLDSSKSYLHCLPFMDPEPLAYIENLPSLAAANSLPSIEESLHIPGALALDPRIRNVRKGSGMRATEGAISLAIIALKQFCENMIRDTIDIKETVAKNSLPGPGVARTDTDKTSKSESSDRKEITAWDLRTTVAIKPLNPSRNILERIFDSSSALGGTSDYQPMRLLRDHIIAEFLSTVQNDGVPLVKPANEIAEGNKESTKEDQMGVSSSGTNKGDQSDRGGGRGSGAKDLAALKAQSGGKSPANASKEPGTMVSDATEGNRSQQPQITQTTKPNPVPQQGGNVPSNQPQQAPAPPGQPATKPPGVPHMIGMTMPGVPFPQMANQQLFQGQRPAFSSPWNQQPKQQQKQPPPKSS